MTELSLNPASRYSDPNYMCVVYLTRIFRKKEVYTVSISPLIWVLQGELNSEHVLLEHEVHISNVCHLYGERRRFNHVCHRHHSQVPSYVRPGETFNCLSCHQC